MKLYTQTSGVVVREIIIETGWSGVEHATGRVLTDASDPQGQKRRRFAAA